MDCQQTVKTGVHARYKSFLGAHVLKVDFFTLQMLHSRELVKEEYLVIILGYFFLFLHKNICCGYSLEMPQ